MAKTAKELVKKLVALGARISEDIYDVQELQAIMLEEMVLVKNNGKMQYHLETPEGKYKFLTKKEFEVGDKITIQLWTQLKDLPGRPLADATPFMTLS